MKRPGGGIVVVADPDEKRGPVPGPSGRGRWHRPWRQRRDSWDETRWICPAESSWVRQNQGSAGVNRRGGLGHWRHAASRKPLNVGSEELTSDLQCSLLRGFARSQMIPFGRAIFFSRSAKAATIRQILRANLQPPAPGADVAGPGTREGISHPLDLGWPRPGGTPKGREPSCPVIPVMSALGKGRSGSRSLKGKDGVPRVGRGSVGGPPPPSSFYQFQEA